MQETSTATFVITISLLCAINFIIGIYMGVGSTNKANCEELCYKNYSIVDSECYCKLENSNLSHIKNFYKFPGE